MTGIAFGARTSRDNNYVGVPKTTGTKALDHLGPGYYDLPPSIKPNAASHTAFGSNSERKFITPQQNATGDAIGPGSYNPQPSRGSTAQGKLAKGPMARAAASSKSAANVRSMRGREVTTPGPGTYTMANAWEAVDRVAMRRAMEAAKAADDMEWVRLPSAPSIPARAQSYGYEEGEHGELVQQRPAKPKGYSGLGNDTPGPMDYNPNTVIKHSRAVSFKGPPRDTVIPRQKRQFGDPDQSLSEAEQHFSPIRSPPRPTSAFVRTKTQPRIVRGPERTPGPGDYGMKSSLNIGRRRPKHQQSFGSRSERFLSGPRSEERPTMSAALLQPPSDFSRPRASRSAQALSGFKSKTERFQHVGSQPASEMVGPGQYYVAGMTDQIRRATEKSQGSGPFGSSSKRFQTFSSFETPGPGQYQPDTHQDLEIGDATSMRRTGGKPRGKLVGRNIKRQTSSFSSTTGRSAPAGKQGVDVGPPPGAYNTAPAWVKKQGVMNFSASSKRFIEKPPEVAVGPGDYELGSTIQVRSHARSLFQAVRRLVLRRSHGTRR